MAVFLGLDTSNYTTSCALYDSESHTVRQQKQLLPVRSGEKGLRQSDAVFHHTVQLPALLEKLELPPEIAGIGVSVRPRNTEGSYMPCFLVGEGTARALGAALHVPVYRTSHQIGHILAALYSAGKPELAERRFLAFHVSGGTTDCVLCEPDAAEYLRVTPVSGSLDLKAGQLVDRVGLMLGLDFPCGIELEKLAAQSDLRVKYKPVMRSADCCLSGLENQCRTMLDKGTPPKDTARFCLLAVASVLKEMTARALELHGSLPVLYAGGVMSDALIQEALAGEERYFAEPAFSCDNAAGTALYAALCSP